jgi:hypothetical protein
MRSGRGDDRAPGGLGEANDKVEARNSTGTKGRLMSAIAIASNDGTLKIPFVMPGARSGE